MYWQWVQRIFLSAPELGEPDGLTWDWLWIGDMIGSLFQKFLSKTELLRLCAVWNAQSEILHLVS